MESNEIVKTTRMLCSVAAWCFGYTPKLGREPRRKGGSPDEEERVET